MKFIKIGVQIINLDTIAHVQLGPPFGAGFDGVTITLTTGKEILFQDEEAEQIRTFFKVSPQVNDLGRLS